MCCKTHHTHVQGEFERDKELADRECAPLEKIKTTLKELEVLDDKFKQALHVLDRVQMEALLKEVGDETRANKNPQTNVFKTKVGTLLPHGGRHDRHDARHAPKARAARARVLPGAFLFVCHLYCCFDREENFERFSEAHTNFLPKCRDKANLKRKSCPKLFSHHF
jgi:hypothetical protein